jgi:Mce-associated membrane protein
VSGGARQTPAKTKSVPVNEDEIPTTAAEIRALADEAEAEAAEAEALAVAARARARAVQLRRQAEAAEAKAAETEKAEVTKEAVEEPAAEEDDAAEPAVAAEQDAAEAEEAEEAEPAVEPEADETADGTAAEAGETVAEAGGATPSAEESAGRFRRVSRYVRRPKWSTVAASLAIIVIVAALAASGYMIKQHRDAERQRQRAAEFVAAARQSIVTLTSLNFDEAREGVQHILDNATGSFKDDFAKTADDYVKTVEQMKVISQGSVQAAAVDWDTMTADSAVVLVASTQEVTNSAGAKQEPRNYRFVLTVTRDRGQLKISKLEFVP